jgi:hypothetical protein
MYWLYLRVLRVEVFCAPFRSLDEAIIVDGNSEHRLLRVFIVHLIGESARLFCALPPMLSIVDEGCCHHPSRPTPPWLYTIGRHSGAAKRNEEAIGDVPQVERRHANAWGMSAKREGLSKARERANEIYAKTALIELAGSSWHWPKSWMG